MVQFLLAADLCVSMSTAATRTTFLKANFHPLMARGISWRGAAIIYSLGLRLQARVPAGSQLVAGSSSP